MTSTEPEPTTERTSDSAPVAIGAPVLTVRGLTVEYETEPSVRAVADLDLVLHRGEILGLAGESGCGKSTLAYALNRLLRSPARIVAGSVHLHSGETDIDVLGLTGADLRRFRWKRIAMVFQGAMNALNPVLTVRTQLVDVLAAHEPRTSAADRLRRCTELMELVGVDPVRLGAYPHELSGGMRQRVMIAMALALRPDVLVMDEPTTALDVVVQRDILRELTALRARLGFAIVFITHDLSLLLEISDRIAIMYAGRIVEQASAGRLLTAPRHPYTVGLLNSFPSVTGPRRRMRGIPGNPPDLSAPIAGCAFAPRCPYRRQPCEEHRPELAPGSMAACHAYDASVYGEDVPAALSRGEFQPIDTVEVIEA
ncbi:ABC transporter ATP-binding protein [Actinoalloteichus hymeniacidonis]|uniref:Oligopeptide/dipeptide ABC transporter, ATP-binding protein n=1 Tax=Actinoalloteichus hymeniacidonis TaxID=340345 RepID=A0AAC9MXQ0_9PSEU|nr:ABC transporter ATP-binding protein [Actinoalloteichus hymeniacidonis]AOS62579.1 oligopeptide/dipeptide ABC transporter, ATP-binding protein [Actinoalloteichus hymeniacidonis]MBB5909390.1 peptide/nickel transport system ATP-binding protein [Actinoalloteichus hymeniacidonis]